MTREEAIMDIQDNILPVVGGKSLQMAIEALKAQMVKSDDLKAESAQNVQNGDLISKKLAIEKDINVPNTDCISRQTAIEWCLEGLNNMPSAQPEVIRCRNCKYWREHKYAKETKRYIPFCGFNAIYTKADDFCSMAERRTDER